jgi:2-oxoglutarate ferredoxin oxidoreductase subunit alpha
MKEYLSNIHEDISIVFAGQAGQGIQTIEDMLSRVLKNSGYNVFATKEYMSRVRGGLISTEIRVSSKPVRSFFDRIDILVSLGQGNLGHLEKRITDKTLIITEKASEDKRFRFVEIPFTNLAVKLGNKIFSNIIATGVIARLMDIQPDYLFLYIKERFSKYSEDIINKNIEAIKKGCEIGEDLFKSGIKIDISKNDKIKEDILITGNDAVSLGAIAGCCNFISAYPMSPGTGVLSYLSKYHKDFGIISEQTEDEISAVNMAIGAWYGGARGMVTTSGGGFALMGEAVSLSGILEVPLVIHIGQRPGPATGLPTRTEQADLELSLYSGHGEFPRIIFAPGNIESAFSITQKAFNLADKYQIPVFILTDQFLIDSCYNTPINSLNFHDIENYFIETKDDYRRYELTENGISPRGIPGYGTGTVIVDSDEHDLEGHITEDFDVRTNMVNKRLKKLENIMNDIVEPILTGNEHYNNLLIGWGSTFETIKEALEKIGRDDLAFLSFSQVYPLHPKTVDYIQKAEKTIIIENNATSQFGKLIRLYTGIEIKDKILKYNGLPFSVEEIIEKVKNLLDGM